MARAQIVVWVVLVSLILLVAELLEQVRFPAAQMIVAMLAGAALALFGKVPAPLPNTVATGVQAMLGVMMGSYLQIELLAKVGWQLAPVAAVAVVSLGVSVVAALLFTRFTGVDLPTATLGLLAGGSAAMVSAADDAGADARAVAFMQYLRVAVVAATAPAIALVLRDDHLGSGGDSSIGDAIDKALPHWALVGRGDQVAGLSIAIVLAIAGSWLGKRLRLPTPTLMGPMLATAVLTSLGLTHGFAPTNLLRDVLFVLIGFEIGARFSRPVIVEMARLIPAVLGAIVALCGVVAAIGFAVAARTGLEWSDVYLATTPGGINAVLGVAESMNADATLIASVQSLRLFLMVLALPIILAVLRSRRRAE
ncbi:AbrB family transcriptional regulator [Nocardia colli]|uniref:AbrB family transcriptional regulator n=1 Tax=Nocardia colli TaxID=2545717 RepID=A0A5N0EL29_9NOCA|nr:AbrB family transcriptional regulator [Nocardia colli]KAA8889459.1 AbrB family transcriptional regulator [Nocardia colli]